LATRPGETFMNLKHLAAAAALALFGAAHAEPIYVDWPVDLTPSTSTLTRAEVQADFELWRLAGQQELHNSELPPDTTSVAYPTPQARYAALRNGPQFAELVKKIEGHPFATVTAKR